MSKKRKETVANGDHVASAKKQKLESGHDHVRVAPSETADSGEEKRLSKEERKALKAARKVEKAEKKAEKKARKEARRARKEAETSASRQASDGEDSAGISSSSSSSAPETNGTALKPREQPIANHTVQSTSSNSAYEEHADLKALPESTIIEYLTSKGITVHHDGSASLRPVLEFSHLSPLLSGQQCQTLFKGFQSPTPVQAAAWPYVLSGRDVVGIAETGSGKTLAFGVPCMKHISRSKKTGAKGVKAVVVAPTRELASQIHEQMEKLAESAGFRLACLYGGVPKDGQRAALKGASLVIATPGRLKDLMQEGSADLSQVDFVVLDEADRMLDKGFEDDIREIIQATRPKSSRQTLMFTATWPPSVRELASTFMTDPVRITIGDNNTGELRANTRITQTVEVIRPEQKDRRLIELLKQNQSGKQRNDRILVFCLYKKEAIRVERNLSRQFKVAAIHGDLPQVKRTAALESFKAGETTVLVATDVAARGLDIPAVKLVINVTFPLTAEDYVHRIGRTGRAGQAGKAITLFTEHDKGLAGALVNVLRAAGQEIPEDLLKFGTTVKKKVHDTYGAFYKDPSTMGKATKITFD